MYVKYQLGGFGDFAALKFLKGLIAGKGNET